MPVGGQEVDVHRLDIDRKRAKRLNPIDAKEDAFLLTEFAQGRQIRAKTAGELHGRDGDHTRAAVDHLENPLERNAPVVLEDHSYINTTDTKRLPRIDVGRKLDVGNHHVVACLPGQTVGNEADALGRVLGERNLVRVGVEQLRNQPPHALDFVKIATANVGVVHRAIDVTTHGITRTSTERPPRPRDPENCSFPLSGTLL